MEIQAQLEDLSSVRKKLTIEVATEVASSEFDRLARDFRKYARIPGFRPGKAPLQLVKRRFFDDIRGEMLQKLVPDSYNQAIEEQELSPISQPDLENVRFKEGQALCYEAVFEVRPEIALPGYQGLELEVEEVSVGDEDVDAEMEALRQRNASLVAVEDRPAESGDFVSIDLSGDYVDDEEPADPIDEKGVVVELGSDRTHAAFNDHLQGLNIGEAATFEVAYEDDYPEKKLAGRRVRFTAAVTDIKRQELPELNDDFAVDLGEYDSLEALRVAVRTGLRQAKEGRRQGDIQKGLVDLLIEASSFEVPEVLIEGKIDRRVRDLAYKIAQQGVDPTRSNVDWRKVRDEFREEAEKEARAGLLLEEIAEAEGLAVASEEVDSELEQMAAGMQQPVEKVRQHFGEKGRREGLKVDMLRRKALQLVVETARINGSVVERTAGQVTDG